MMRILTMEPPVDPDDRYVCLDCGCECYENTPYIVFDGKSWCRECLCDYLKTLDYDEIGRLLDADVREMVR